MKRLNELLGIEFPVIQGGMANIATGEFAAAVSNAGGLGVIGTGGWDAERTRAEIRSAKERTDRPFGVNLMLMNPHADEIARVVAEEGVRVVTTGAGSPGKYIPLWKDAGVFVMPVVASALLARRLSKFGADALIAEGCESGGHIGEMTTLALVPQAAQAVDLPVVAAGGIACGRQLAAAMLLGACGVQVGTCLLVSEECPIHENYKRALLAARGSDTVVTGRSSGAPVRVLKNRMAKEYLRMEKQALPLEELERLTLGSLRRAVVDGDVENGSLMAGQSTGLLHEIRPLRVILEELVSDGRAALSQAAGESWL